MKEWHPIGVTLERDSELAVRSPTNTLVIAGPGAGKTELLAQRACYLLQTELCPDPYRILAISFKRDAARNLRERVEARCGVELARRFDSYTFDSFAKSLIDHFRAAIPDAFRPTVDYSVFTELYESTILRHVGTIPSNILPLSTSAIAELSEHATWQSFTTRSLPLDGIWANTSNADIAASALWSHWIQSSPSTVGFPMLGWLAELLLRCNPQLGNALRCSYRFVFLDEFQDTASRHYAMIRTAFAGSKSVLTAVGDGKQRIMMWAGAMRNVFELYQQAFGTQVIRLAQNHRSVKHLVDIQTVVARDIDSNHTDAIAQKLLTSGECKVLVFNNDDTEAAELTSLIGTWLRTEGLRPRDICILCRKRPDQYAAKLMAALQAAGIDARLENEMQDLLAESITTVILDLFKLACIPACPESWQRAVRLLRRIRNVDDDAAVRALETSLLLFLDTLAVDVTYAFNEQEIGASCLRIIEFYGLQNLQAEFPEYAQEDWLVTQVTTLAVALKEARIGLSWPDAIAKLEGHNTIPIMSIHKSKGLEFDTVVLIGLEDSAWFGFRRRPDEEKCTFFVALSRAKRRVLFTYCQNRTTGRGGRMVPQSHVEIKPLYSLLKTAGVAMERVRL